MKNNEDINAVDSEFSVIMKIPYEMQFLGLALECMARFFGAAGSAQKDSAGLRLALEETLAFLINSYPDAESWELINLNFKLKTDGLAEIDITNAGPPVHLDRIPQHNPDAPEDSDMDGLWYFLASKAVDDLSFKNQGKNGWQAIIRKHLPGVSFRKKTQSNGQEATAIKKNSFTTRLSTPEDAAALVDLTYDTYRYSYPSDDFYHVSKLRQALENREIISIIVEADGVLVGNSSLGFSADMPHCGYSCSLMVKPAFRQSRAIIHLLKAVKEYISNNPTDMDLYYGTTVTTHTGSQKAGIKVGFSPLALLLAACPSADFRGVKTSSNDRITFLLCVYLTSTPKLPIVYLPEQHHSVMTPLLTQAGFTSKLSWEEAALNKETSSFTLKEDIYESSAYIMLNRMGRDFVSLIQKNILKLKAKGIHAIIILIPAWYPIPPLLDQEMGRINAFFTGMKPVSDHESYLVYCTISGTIDFDNIRIMDPLADNLKEHCRRLYQEVLGE